MKDKLLQMRVDDDTLAQINLLKKVMSTDNLSEIIRRLIKDRCAKEAQRIVVEIVRDNISHVQSEIVCDYPSGNVFVGMTQDDYEIIVNQLKRCF